MNSNESTDLIFPQLELPGGTGTNRDLYLASLGTDRDLTLYMRGFGINESMLIGKKVLDLGAGRYASFTADVIERGIVAIAVNPAWSDSGYANVANPSAVLHRPAPRVAAVAESLPFASSSFDVVLALWSVPYYLSGTRNTYLQAFSEIRRVTSEDGYALLKPIPEALFENPAFIDVLAESVGPQNYVPTWGPTAWSHSLMIANKPILHTPALLGVLNQIDEAPAYLV